MRHVPEDELHAYLDQALSRSQCAEIETHLSACTHCQDQRDAVAALRDRTTALLSRLAPRPLIVPPQFDALLEGRRRMLALAVWRVRLQRAGLWAAGITAAVGAGWLARSELGPHQTPPMIAQQPAAPADTPAQVAAVTPDPTADLEKATPIPIPERRPVLLAARPAGRRTANAVVPAPTLHLAAAVMPFGVAPVGEATAPVTRANSHDPFERIWRVVSWEEALQLAGSRLPFIEGLPVVGVLFQPGGPGERPTVIVAQQEAGGEVIQSIEGPTSKVTEMLQRQAAPDVHSSDPSRTPPDYVEVPGGVRRANRILTVTGRLPLDSLNALARIATIR